MPSRKPRRHLRLVKGDRIDPGRALEVLWRDTQFVDVLRMRRRLERCKDLAEALERLLEDARRCRAEALLAVRRGFFISTVEKVRFRKISEVLDGVVREIERANGPARRQAANARGWLGQSWLQVSERAGSLPPGTPGRPSRTAEFIRRMFELDPSLPRSVEPWLELDRAIGFTLRTDKSEWGGEGARKVITQVLRRLQTLPVRK